MEKPSRPWRWTGSPSIRPVLCSKPSGCVGQAEGSLSWAPAWMSHPQLGAEGGGEVGGGAQGERPPVLTFSPVFIKTIELPWASLLGLSLNSVSPTESNLDVWLQTQGEVPAVSVNRRGWRGQEQTAQARGLTHGRSCLTFPGP